MDSITLHTEAVRKALTAMRAHSPSASSIMPGGCVCYKCEDARTLAARHAHHSLRTGEHGIYCNDCSDWMWYQ